MGEFLNSITLDFIEPCTTEMKRIKFFADFDRDISELFPYLNGKIKSAVYNPAAGNISYKHDFKLITLYPTRLAVAKAINEHDAYEIMDKILELINSTYENKEKIEPVYERRSNPSTIEIYKYLPKTNCKSCECSTCLAFAAKLISGEYKLSRCKPLYAGGYDKEKDKLMEMAQMFGWD